jgi:hypothetical protein
VAAAQAMLTLAIVLHHLGDPRWATLATEAVALLEPLPPSPVHVAALIGVARAEGLNGRLRSSIHYAEQALDLAAQLGLDRPAQALDRRGWARATLGDRNGLADFRDAIAVATTAGQGSDVVTMQNNLGLAMWGFDGPTAALDVLGPGVAYANARGLAGAAAFMTASGLAPMIDTGRLDDARDVAASLANSLSTLGDALVLIEVAATETRLSVMRGQVALVADRLDWLEVTSRETGDPQEIVMGLGSVALARSALGQPGAASALLTEVDATPGARENANYPHLLPAMVRTALAVDGPALAERLVSGVQPGHPYTGNALTASNAALAEARGELAAAADAYDEGARRWEQFGVVPERAFALLGQGRCCVMLARPTEALPVLQKARTILEQLGAKPALAEADGLLGEATEHRS